MEIIIFDTEYLTDDGVMKRNWNGIFDPPPMLVQIGGYKLSIAKGLPVIDEISFLVNPADEEGNEFPITPYFENLTNLKEKDIRQNGKSFKEVMENFTNFIGDRYTYSYGKDFLRPIIQSCFYTGTFCKVKAKQTRDIRKILLKANMSLEEIQSNSSGSLAKHFGINFDFDFEHIHDARYDAMSIIATLRHLEQQNRLDINWLIE